jgi:hypothetical protein
MDTDILDWRGLERETGIEPATSSLGSWRSTAELLPLIVRQVHHYISVPFPLLFCSIVSNSRLYSGLPR